MENNSSRFSCYSTTCSAPSFFSDGHAGIGGTAPPTSALSPDLNRVPVPIATTSGNILGHLNLSDGLVHGIDGYIIGTWLAQSPSPFGFRTLSSDIFLDSSPCHLSLPAAIESTPSSIVLSTKDFDIDSALSMHWPSPPSASSITRYLEPEDTRTSLNISDDSEWSFRNSVPEGAWAESDTSSHVTFDLDLDAILDSLENFSSHSKSPDSTQSYCRLSRAPSIPQTVSATSNINAPTQVQPLTRFQCGHCSQSFKRDYDRGRHERSIHSSAYGRFVCPIAECPRSQGAGYCRADKVKEHLWRKHGDLGYAKAA
ncbi:hypothetical protein BGZ57DRAFT_917260 [Hyaloscypha finlandica]|nr:hypothetical protein BGZ57DRAFT_917260 [Hyaloscypha finlandica]